MTPRNRKVALCASYRSKDSILDFVNALFKQVYGDRYADDEVLIPGKEETRRFAATGRRNHASSFFWRHGREIRGGRNQKSEEIPDLEARVKTEMTAVAQRIKLLVDGPESRRTSYRYSDDTERFEPVSPSNRYRYSDILILLRRTTNRRRSSASCEYRASPTASAGAARLIREAEVIDTLLFLKVLTQPFDTISLIGFLRSPWVGLSHDSILQLWMEGQLVR